MVCTDLEPPEDEDLTERTVDRYRSILVEIDTAFQGRVLTMEQGLSILLFDTAELAVGAAVVQHRPSRIRARLQRRSVPAWLYTSSPR